MSNITRIEDRTQEIVFIVERLAEMTKERMTLNKNLKKRRWRSKQVTLEHLLKGVESNLSNMYARIQNTNDPEKVWKEAADAAAFLAMAAEKYEMLHKGIEEIALGD